MGYRKRPSFAATWTRCAKALAFTLNYPNNSSPAADEGTMCHKVREWCLELGFDSFDFIGQKFKINGVTWTFDEDLAEAIQPGIDEIREYDGRMLVEQYVDTTPWVGPDDQGRPQGGTIDCGVIGEHLYFQSDLKAGRGVAVQAVGNDQQVIYAIAAYEQFIKHEAPNCKNFMLAIDQPRNHAGGGYWPLTLEELLAEGERIKRAAEAADDPNACFNPGPKQCQWCPAANVPHRVGGCPAHAAANLDHIDMDFDDLDAPEQWQPPIVDEMTPARLIHLSQHKKSIEQFLEYAHAKALEHLMDNGPDAGHKAVLGRRPPRKWASTDAAEAFMRQKLSSADPFNKKLKTPSQAEKEVGKNYEIPKSLVEQGQPKPIMVPVEDEREAIRPFNDDIENLDAEFDNLDDL